MSVPVAEAKTMFDRRPWLRNLPFALVVLLTALGLTLVQYFKPADPLDVERDPRPLVECTAVAAGDGQLVLDADGEVKPVRQVSLAAQVAGRIVAKTPECLAGRFVTAGTRLLSIDPRDYDLEIRRTQELLKQTDVSIEELDVARSNTEQLVQLAKSDVELQGRELERFEQLRQQQAASQAALDSALRARIQAENNLQTLRNEINVLETRRGRLLSEKDRLAVELEAATLKRKRCDILAPIDGMIVDDPVEQDDFVQPGTKLVQLEDTAQVEVRFDLRFDQLRWIWESQGQPHAAGQDTTTEFAETDPEARGVSYRLPPLPMEVAIDVDGRRFVWDAVLSRYDGAWLNRATRTVPCIAIVAHPNAGHWADRPSMPEEATARRSSPPLSGPPTLLRGMFVALRINVPATQPLVQIPTTALRPGNRVWRVAGQTLTTVRVKIAQAHEQHVDLFADDSSLQPGDQIVISPLALAVDGMEVRLASHDQRLTPPQADLPAATNVGGPRDANAAPAATSPPRKEFDR